MKKQMNLIPIEMTVSQRSVRLQKLLFKLSTIGAILLSLSTVILISVFVYYNKQQKDSLARSEFLKNKISTLEKSEQKLILAKDRLTKISIAKKIDSVDKEFLDFKKFQEDTLMSYASSSSVFSETVIDPNKTETSLTLLNSTSVATFLKSIQNLSFYKKIVLSSLGYNLKSGFLMSMVFQD